MLFSFITRQLGRLEQRFGVFMTPPSMILLLNMREDYSSMGVRSHLLGMVDPYIVEHHEIQLVAIS